MFKLAEPEKIGKYISDLVERSNYKSQRQFCIAWLEYEKQPIDDVVVNKRSNKFSQIKKGRKSIQLQDLPVFCSLLHVSCEEILSAGEEFKPEKQRLTNYAVAFSKEEEVWEEYVNDVENLILNADERGNTVLDYAVKFKNTDFIDYLVEKGYIWFDDGDEGNVDYSMSNFGAGTSIKRRTVSDYDYYLQPQLQNVAFRGKIMALAIEKNDLKLLKEMKAREIPDYYYRNFYYSGRWMIGDMCRNTASEDQNYNDFYNRYLVDNIADADEKIIDYYTDSFKISKDVDNIPGNYRFTYLFISELLEKLVVNNHRFAENALKKAINYSEETYAEVKKELIEYINEDFKSMGGEEADAEYAAELKRGIVEKYLDEFEYDEKTEIIRVSLLSYRREEYMRIVRNLIHVNAESDNLILKPLINQLNELFSRILNIKNEILKEA